MTPKNCPKPFLFTAVLASSLALTAHAALAGSIGVNFVNNGDAGVQNGATDSIASGELAGVVPQMNWNNFGRWGDGVGLKNDLGLTTTAAATWDAIGVWTTGASLATGDGKLMNGYLDPSWGSGTATADPGGSVFGAANVNKPLVYLSGLSAWLAAEGATSYDIILYVDGDGTDGRIGEHWVQAVTGPANAMTAGADLTPHLFGADGSNFGGTFTQISNNATSQGAAEVGNYKVFSGLTNDQVLIRSSAVTGWAPDSISGFQIIAVPEPTSAMLVGLGAALLGLRRRRV